MKVSVTFRVSLPIFIKKDGKHFISCCPVLDVWSQGKTREKAESNLKEAVRLFLVDCFERGTLEKVLKDCGFVAQRRVQPRKQMPPHFKEIDVPLPFVIDQHLVQCPG